MIRTVTLKEHLPNFIQKYREIQKIMEAENPEFQYVMDESEKIKDNQFIESCDEDGISRFEEMMRIIPLETDTLQSRISRVLTRWNKSTPYTYFFLLRKLNSLCGINNYEIIRNIDKYEMEIITHLELSGQIDELLYLLDDLIPANILCTLKNEIVLNPKTEMITSGGVIYCDLIQITN